MNTATRSVLASSLALLAACAAGGDPQRAPSVIQAEADEIGLANAHAPFPGILTGGQPSEEQFDLLAEAGYRLFVNLRPATEPGTGWEQAAAEELGVGYVSIPVAGAGDVTEANARLLSEVLAGRKGPAVVYCRSGNRVGALFALSAHHVDGKSVDESLEVGRSAGLTKLEPVVRDLLER